jgi:nucleoside-diphosphate-sugar epimerase
MEELIKRNIKSYLIYRLPQIVGDKGNKNNLFNHIKNNIINNQTNLIYIDAVRSLIDVDDLINFVIYSKHLCNEIIIFSYIKKIKVSELCIKISNILGIKPKVVYNNKKILGNEWSQENSLIVIEWLRKIDKEDYNDRLIKKYIQNGDINWIL